MIPFFMYIGLIIFLIEGSLIKKIIVPKIHIPPLINTVFEAPIELARVPAIKLPKGDIPIKAIVKKLTTLPRLSSSVIVCKIVFVEAMCIIIPNPLINIIESESHKFLETEKIIRLSPKMPVAAVRIFPRPKTVLLDARYIPPTSAPIPDEAIKKPRKFGPPCSISFAKIGMSTVYGIPIRLISPKKSKIDLMGTQQKAYLKPSFISLAILFEYLFFGIFLIFIARRAAIADIKLIPLIRKQKPSPTIATRIPATAGPIHLALF